MKSIIALFKALFQKTSFIIALLVLISCSKEDSADLIQFNLEGTISDAGGKPLQGVVIRFHESDSVVTDSQGKWLYTAKASPIVIEPSKNHWTFSPKKVTVSEATKDLHFTGTPEPVDLDQIKAFSDQYQKLWLSNNLVELLALYKVPLMYASDVSNHIVLTNTQLLGHLEKIRLLHNDYPLKALHLEIASIEGTYLEALVKGSIFQFYIHKNGVYTAKKDYNFEWKMERIGDELKITRFSMKEKK